MVVAVASAVAVAQWVGKFGNLANLAFAGGGKIDTKLAQKPLALFDHLHHLGGEGRQSCESCRVQVVQVAQAVQDLQDGGPK